ncbi:MAG: phenylalanine--tRNA ligase subunit beta [Nitrososphaerota archaeon]
MPTISFDKEDLINLIGKKINEEELLYCIRQFKGEIKNFSNEEILIELEPDRPDLFSIEGLSRAIKGYFGIEKSLHKSSLIKIIDSKISIKIINAKLRPFVASAIVKNVKFTDKSIKSLMNTQEALNETIGRGRRKVAIGIHDFDKIEPPIYYSDAPSNFKIVPLDFYEEMTLEEVLYKHPKGIRFKHLLNGKNFPIYYDRLGIFSFPPIINSERTRVTEETKNLFIEITGTNDLAVKQTLNILVSDLIDRGGLVQKVKIEGKIKYATPDLKPKKHIVKINDINNLIGLKLTPKKIKDLLERMRYGIGKIYSDKIEVLYPAYRIDILHSVDIIEDIAIAYGYDKLIPEMPKISTIGSLSSIEKEESRIRQTLIGLGFQEVRTFTLSNEKLQTELMNLEKLDLIEIENPVTIELNCFRRWITPHLMNFLSINKHVKYPQRIFEIGYVAFPDEKFENKARTLRNTAVVIASSETNFSEIKSILEASTSLLGWNIEIIEENYPYYINGRSVKIIKDGKEIGFMGEIHPKILNNFELEVPVTSFEITHRILK